MQYKKIVLLAGKWDTTPIVFNYLKQTTGVDKAVIEEGVPRKEFLKKRIKKLGWIAVGGQVLFQVLIGKLLSKTSVKRIKEILYQYGLNDTPIPESSVINIPSVNSDECLHQLNMLQPDIVIVHGTRIISKKILQTISCPFINIHAGITPRYRGSHGAYWALASNDQEHCGVTVHLVDAGIDTGTVLCQKKIPLTRSDNFATYPYLQLAEGLSCLENSIRSLSEGKTEPWNKGLDSALWHHPTLWGYLYKRITRGVK